jgi:hypothetical protein
MFDLAKHDPKELDEIGYEFELKDRYGDSSGAFVTVRGKESPILDKLLKDSFNSSRAKNQRNIQQKKFDTEPTLEEMEDQSIDFAIKAIKSWRGIVKNGKEIPFSEGAAYEILKAHRYIRLQIEEASATADNFRPKRNTAGD